MLTYYQKYSMAFNWEQKISQEVLMDLICDIQSVFRDHTFRITVMFPWVQWVNKSLLKICMKFVNEF